MNSTENGLASTFPYERGEYAQHYSSRCRSAGQRRADQADPSTTSAGDGGNSSPPARKSAIITVRDRKTVQRQREQQHMAKLMQGDNALASSEGIVRRSAIIRKPRQFDDITPEEHKRRGDAADALFQEMKRRIAGALRPGGALPRKKS